MIAQIVINGLVAGLSWGLVAIGFSLVYSTARFLHAAHATTYLAGAYTGVWLTRDADASGIVAAVAAMASGGALGLLLELGIYRPLRKLGSSSLVLFLSSLALVIVAQNVVGLIFGSEILVAGGRIERGGFQVLGARITSWQAISAGVAVSLFLTTWGLVRFSRIGKKMRAIATDPELADAVGISRDNTLLLTICLGSTLAGGTGFLIGHDTALTPAGSIGVLLTAITAVIVGGIGSIPGAMLGGLFVGVAQHVGVWKLPVQWQDTIVFVILILFLLLRPQGFLGKPLRRAAV